MPSRNRSRVAKPEPVMLCTPVSLPPEEWEAANQLAFETNPANRPNVERIAEAVRAALPEILTAMLPGGGAALLPDPGMLTALRTSYWGAAPQEFSVAFMESVNAAVRDRILSHANAWSEFTNKTFRWTQQISSADCRISLGTGGYYSYLGTDNKRIPANRQTMNLERFSQSTPESEYKRVVRHEFGHFLAFPHEHMRRTLVARLDAEKTIEYFRRTQGWSAATTRQQVLTPLEESSLIGGQLADQDSIMAYQLPGSITVDGQPIRGGSDFSGEDRAVAGKLYPKAGGPPPPGGKVEIVLRGGALQPGVYVVTAG